GVIDRILGSGDRDYLTGEYSIGDIMHFPWLRIAQSIGADWVTSRPRVVDWLDRIAERPAVERGMAIPT
ncbi:MAG: glutathione S-transferase C-terminal domain-containing protein, partial [Myxococcales bacterium]